MSHIDTILFHTVGNSTVSAQVLKSMIDMVLIEMPMPDDASAVRRQEIGIKRIETLRNSNVLNTQYLQFLAEFVEEVMGHKSTVDFMEICKIV